MTKTNKTELMPVPERRSNTMSFMATDSTKILLKKLSKIHGASVTTIIETMVLEKSKEYGLIESRD